MDSAIGLNMLLIPFLTEQSEEQSGTCKDESRKASEWQCEGRRLWLRNLCVAPHQGWNVCIAV